MARIKRNYQCFPLPDTFEKEVVERVWNKKNEAFEDRKRIAKGGYVVVFPQGHSLYIETDGELARMKAASGAEVIDLDMGAPLNDQSNDLLMSGQYDRFEQGLGATTLGSYGAASGVVIRDGVDVNGAINRALQE